MDIIQFNIPPADSHGIVNHPPPGDQYPIDDNSIISDYSTESDWAVFGVLKNSTTNLNVFDVQNDFYRLSKDIEISTEDELRITGFGHDDTPAGPGPPTYSLITGLWHYLNAHNRTQQSAIGYQNGTSSHTFYTDIPVARGVSGGPLVHEDSGFGIGIQVFGSSSPSGTLMFCASGIQRFSREALLDAIELFPGNDVVYLDENHSQTSEEGTFFHPYLTIQESIDNVPNGGIVSMVKGVYPGAVSIDKAVRLEAPVGNVTIGGSGSFKINHPSVSVRQIDTLTKQHIRLLPNYPNPFNPTTTIRYELLQGSMVRLEVFDMLGRRVAVLTNEFQQPGTHEVVFDASHLASGLYFYRIIDDTSLETKSMMLLK